MNKLIEALERIAAYPSNRSEEMSIETAREIARAALASQAQQEPRTQNLDHVICPACAHDFRAIPENVQSLLISAGFEPPFLSQAQQPTDLSKQLREYAADSGYSHNDYADTMLAAAYEIERCVARLAASQAQQNEYANHDTVEHHKWLKKVDVDNAGKDNLIVFDASHEQQTESKQGCKECDGQTYMHSPTGEYLGECPYCTKEQDPYAYDVPTEDGTELAYAIYYTKYNNPLPEGAIPLYASQQEPVRPWICPDFMLPPRSEEVLVYPMPNNVAHTAFHDGECWRVTEYENNYGYSLVALPDGFIKGWMPLPPAPEGEKE